MSNYQFIKIDPETATKDEIQKEIQRLTHIMIDNKNMEQGLKIFLNSVYGAIGNQYFACYNPDMAEAVTLQGQSLIKYTANCINQYFQNNWFDDVETHEKLNITVKSNIINDMVVYIDTDSNYVSFEEVIKSVENFEKLNISEVDFIKQLYQHKLKEFFVEKLDRYSKKWNTDNIQDFELELIAHSGIWLAKKKYMLDVAWTDRGILYKPQEKIKSTGVEIIQTKTSKFIRDKLMEIVKYIFKKGSDLDISTLSNSLKKLKNRFKLMDIDEISLSQKLSDYEKYVINDKTKLELRSKCPVHIRAAAIHNWMVNSKPQYRNKYTLIKSGDKIKFYYTKNKSEALNVIGYLPGYLPQEFLEHFPFDYDTMFEKIVLMPINRILDAIGKHEIPKNLVTVKGLL